MQTHARVVGPLTVVLVLVSLVCATGASAQDLQRGWIDVNFGIASPAEGSLDTQLRLIRFEEIATFGGGYRTSRGSEFDVGGGGMLTPMLGVGVSLAGMRHENPASLRVSIPHPAFFNRMASDAASTDGNLKRRERLVNLQAVAQVPGAGGKLRVRFFGGPTYFQLTADAVTDIRYRQTFTSLGGNTVEILSSENKEVNASAWGFNAGADIGYFFTRIVGIGASFRYARGTVQVSDAEVLNDGPREVKMGGVQTGGGLRIRF
jgi:hypothetical protein